MDKEKVLELAKKFKDKSITNEEFAILLEEINKNFGELEKIINTAVFQEKTKITN